MKNFLAFLLAIIVFTGSVYPCCVEDECQDEATAHQATAPEQGVCSPFFACAACPGFVHLERPIIIPCLFIPYTAHFEVPIHFTSSSYRSPLFQPPRAHTPMS